jgi:phosphoserine aminotransferase
MKNNEHRVFNFSAGPCTLPLEVLEEVQADLIDYKGTGESVMEMSHRSAEFKKIAEDAEADLRKLMSIPDNYKVLFLQGGGTLQFSMIPINLLRNSKKADYVITGSWSNKAEKEAEKFGDIRIAASSEDKNYTYVPRVGKDDFRPDADYVYICFNETINGIHYEYIPDTGDIPLVCDMSSCILSEEIDVSKFGLIFAGAQKNIAPAGLTIVIIRDDLLGFAPENTPVYLDYKIHADKDSMYNTPNCWSIYVAGEVFKYLLRRGGVAAQHELNVKKAKMLYDAIDSSSLYTAAAEPGSRSLMNVDFVTGDPDLDKKFVAEAREHDIINVNGHRSVGGMRASIFNAMPLEGVEALISFMKEFEDENK